MPRIRRCAQCQEPKLMPISRKMQVYNSIIHYKCANCAAEVEITPVASIGVVTMVGILAFGFWGSIIFNESGAHDTITLSLYGAASIAFFLFAFAPLIRHLRNPLQRDSKPVQISVDSAGDHIARGPILWIENLGYFAGLLAPLVIVICVLGSAALIGYVNFTYFN